MSLSPGHEDIPLHEAELSFDPQATSTPLPDSPASVATVEASPPLAEGSSTSQGKGRSGFFTVPLAARRSVVEASPKLAMEKEVVLSQARELWRRDEPVISRSLSGDDEIKLYNELSALTRALEGVPAGRAVFEGPAYKPSPVHHARLMELLLPRMTSLNRHLLAVGRPPVELPVWGVDGDIESAWDTEIYIQLAVLFREEVETFLAMCLHPDDNVAGTYASRREKARQEREEREKESHAPFPNPFAPLPAAKPRAKLPAKVTIEDDFSIDKAPPPIGSSAGHTPHPRATTYRGVPKPPTTAPPSILRSQSRYPITVEDEYSGSVDGPPYPPSSFATSANTTPITPRTSRSDAEIPLSAPIDERTDVRTIREELAQGRAPQASTGRKDEDTELPHARHGSSRRLSEIFEDPPFLSSAPYAAGGHESSWRTPNGPNVQWEDAYGGDDGTRHTFTPSRTPGLRSVAGGGGGGGRGGFGGRSSQIGNTSRGTVDSSTSRLGVPHFDMKLKVDLIEEWDGDTDTIIDWFEAVNAIAARSDVVFAQLGELVPTRLRKKAKSWWLSLPQARRANAMQNWSTLRRCIAKYYMGRQWFDRLKLKARSCRFRDSEAPSETPSEYFIRKFKLLDTAEDYSESLMIMSIMDGAPKFWRSIIDTMTLRDTADLQDKIHYHEDALRQSPLESNYNLRGFESRLKALEEGRKVPTRRFPLRAVNANKVSTTEQPQEFTWEVSANLVGYSKELPKPLFPRDDTVRSKGKTPEDKGARPCRHCGSPKHWDNDCKHSRKGMKQVRSNLATAGEDYWDAQEDYEELYYASSQEDDDDSEEESHRLN